MTVALKVIRPEVTSNPYIAREMERRFKRELLLAREVSHNNVVRIHDLGEISGIKYITMWYVEGRDLATILDAEPRLTPTRALHIVRGVVAGLLAAHEAGVVHRDLKPANIMIDVHGEARIMDFGIARSTSPSTVDGAGEAGPTGALAGLQRQAAVLSDQTIEGAIVGTVAYMAPEQAQGKPVDQRVDVYALGLIFYDMLGGLGRVSRSHNGKSELTARMKEAPPSIRTIYPEVPEALEKVIARCLEPDLDARYRTTMDLEADLQRLENSGDGEARTSMLLGSHFAGIAIEQSMLGAAHACSNPLTARYDLAHGLALSILLPTVVRWNATAASDRYAALIDSNDPKQGFEQLAATLERFAAAGGLGGRLRDYGVAADALPDLASLAAEQWTGTFNPRPFDAAAALEIYRAVY